MDAGPYEFLLNQRLWRLAWRTAATDAPNPVPPGTFPQVLS